ncbi:hypothetical protein L1987_45341 [Smallanthus sonchifolius]|uniref:Uncharacterized protein n=1 Tax=Smallanthus sonchifolius TaxID=185202 RepID=A0ACB9GU30_9ASTR|nr:hypothetical protein L1987_45341 [Smallanthus sonchifolius]
MFFTIVSRRLLSLYGGIKRLPPKLSHGYTFPTATSPHAPSTSTIAKPQCTYGPPTTGAATSLTWFSSMATAETPSGNSYCRWLNCHVISMFIFQICGGGEILGVWDQLCRVCGVPDGGDGGEDGGDSEHSENQKTELLKKVGRNVLVPEKPEEIRTLCRMSMYKFNVGKLFPDFFLRGFIAADGYKKEKKELVESLLLGKPDLHIPVLTQVQL